MTIRITEDLSEAGGYARVDLGRKLDWGDRKLSIRRTDAEPRHLGQEEWQPEVAWLPVEGTEQRSDTTVLRIGPAIVDRIEELVRVELVAEGELPLGVVSWPALTPSPGISGALALQTASNAKSSPADLVSSMTEVAVSQEQAPFAIEQSAPSIKAAPVVAKDEIRESAPTSSGNKFGLAAAIVIALVIAVAAGTFAWRKWASNQEAPRPPVQAEAPPAPNSSELDRRMASILRQGADPAALIALGQDALGEGRGALAFRAFEVADPFSSSEAAFQLARFYDPRNTDPHYRAAAQPNPARAIVYYSLWKNRSAQHTAELKSLCAASANIVSGNARLAAACRQ